MDMVSILYYSSSFSCGSPYPIFDKTEFFFTNNITLFRLWVLCAVTGSLLFVYSCKQGDSVVISIPPVSQITDAMAKELPSDVLKKISDIQQTKFTNVDQSYFDSKSSIEDVINKINDLNTASRPVGQVLYPKTTSAPRAREGNEDPPGSRRVTFYSNSSLMNAFDGQVDIRYSRDANGNATGFTYNSNVAITALGVNFGNYTQTGVTTSTYKTTDGNTVVVFEITGTYTPSLIGIAGVSNNWVFTGYVSVPDGASLSLGNFLRGYCSMRVATEGFQ